MGQDDSGVVNDMKTSVSVIGEVLRIAGENADTRQAGAELGKTALTITKTINNALLPLAAVNFAFEKARTYFADRFPKDITEKIASIPAEALIEPKPSVAGPALQGLAFAHEEPDLKAMYLGLLGTAMDGRTAEDAHPGFVEIIRQLTAVEARRLKAILSTSEMRPIIEIQRREAKTSFVILMRHVMALGRSDKPHEDPRHAAMVDNWIRLGLVIVDYSKALTGGEEDFYAWAEGRPELLRYRATYGAENVSYQRGVIGRSALGEQFAAAVGIQPGESATQATG